jgi:O-antigen/teichoic acid export membrane protein
VAPEAITVNLARQGASVFLSNWAVMLVQLIVSVLVIRTIGAENKGAQVVLTATVALIAMLGQFGFPAAAIYFARSGTYRLRTLLVHFLALTCVVTALTCMLALLFHSGFVAVFLQGSAVRNSEVWLALASLPATMIYQFMSSLLLGIGDTASYRQLTVGFGLINAALTVLLVIVLPFSVVGILFAALISYSLTAAVAVWQLIRRTAGESWKFELEHVRTLFRFGLQQYAGTVGSQMFKRADIYLLAYFLDATAVGVYSVALTAYDVMLSIPRAINSLLAGQVAAGGGSAAMITAATARNVFWLMSFVSLGLLVVAPFAVPLLYGSEFAAAVLPLSLLLVATVLMGGATNLQAYFLGAGRPDLNGLFTLLSGGVNVILSLLLIPLAGIAGNALATLLASALLLALNALFFMRLSKQPLASLWKPQPDDIVAWRAIFGRVVRMSQRPGALLARRNSRRP